MRYDHEMIEVGVSVWYDEGFGGVQHGVNGVTSCWTNWVLWVTINDANDLLMCPRVPGSPWREDNSYCSVISWFETECWAGWFSNWHVKWKSLGYNVLSVPLNYLILKFLHAHSSSRGMWRKRLWRQRKYLKDYAAHGEIIDPAAAD